MVLKLERTLGNQIWYVGSWSCCLTLSWGNVYALTYPNWHGQPSRVLCRIHSCISLISVFTQTDHFCLCCCCPAAQLCPDPLRPHGLQHARLPCLSPSPRACWNARPLNRWCHPTISTFVVPFSSCPQSLYLYLYIYLDLKDRLKKIKLSLFTTRNK